MNISTRAYVGSLLGIAAFTALAGYTIGTIEQYNQDKPENRTITTNQMPSQIEILLTLQVQSPTKQEGETQ